MSSLTIQDTTFSQRSLSAPIKSIWIMAVTTLILAAITSSCTSSQEIPELELRAQRLNKVIMCPACPGESIDQSQNDLAIKIRGIVIQKLTEGWTDDQIKTYLVQAYGTSVLLEPPRKGFSLVVWIFPAVGIFGAALALIIALRLMRRPDVTQSPQIGQTSQISEEERSKYFERIQLILDGSKEETTPEENDRIAGHEKEKTE